MKLTTILNEEYTQVTEKIKEEAKIDTVIQEKLLSIFEDVKQEKDIFLLDFPEGVMDRHVFYDKTLELFTEELKSVEYSQTDIGSFCFTIPSVEESEQITKPMCEASIFLSALINTHYARTKTEETYILPLTEIRLNTLCYGILGGNIKIIGDVNHYLCENMKAGNVEVFGNAKERAGVYMQGGTLHIYGNTGNALGLSNNSGTIIVEKYAPINVGLYMNFGKITVQGSIGMRAIEIYGGEVWEKDKLIYPTEMEKEYQKQKEGKKIKNKK